VESSFRESSSRESSSRKQKGPVQSSCVYTSCYCEENVWKLCESIRNENIEHLNQYHVVFISNDKRQIPIWMQSNQDDPLTPVVWDYHVILVRKTTTSSMVYDLDSILPFPCPLEQYTQQALRSEKDLKKHYHRRFRVIEASRFLETFASDRSHMKQSNGEYVKPPPSYPPIRTDEEEMNLEDFIDMSPELGEGRVKDLKGFLKIFNIEPI